MARDGSQGQTLRCRWSTSPAISVALQGDRSPSECRLWYGYGMMLVVAVAATVLAFIQNLVMFAFGMKEMAIASWPLSFVGILLLEISLIWIAYFAVRKYASRRRAAFLGVCVILILGAAETALPVSTFTTFVQQYKRKRVLRQIVVAGSSVKVLNRGEGGIRFALTYTLRFPRTAHYLTFPAYLGPSGNRVFGNYAMKLHPEYYDENYVFEAAKPYSFTVVFDTQGKQYDLSKEIANIDICDGKDYFMACRIIAIDLKGVPAAQTGHAPLGRHETAVRTL